MVGLEPVETVMAQQSRRIPLSPEALEAIERQLEAFRRKFGRDPNDNDPILFDPDADDPVSLRMRSSRCSHRSVSFCGRSGDC